jgi:hypothetical protein
LVPFVAFTVLYKCALWLSVTIRHKGTWDWAQYGGAQLYFLPYLFVVSAAVAVVSVVVRPTPARLVVLTGAAALVTLLLCPATRTHGPHPELAGLYTANYLAGVCWRVGPKVLPTVLLLCGAVGAAWWGGNWNLAAAAVPPLAFALLGPLTRTAGTGALEWLGRWSGAVFVWHVPFLLPAAAAFAVGLFGGGYGALAVALALTIEASVALGWVADKWSLLHPFRL